MSNNDLVVDAKIIRKYSHVGTIIPQYTLNVLSRPSPEIFLFKSGVQKGELTALVYIIEGVQ